MGGIVWVPLSPMHADACWAYRSAGIAGAHSVSQVFAVELPTRAGSYIAVQWGYSRMKEFGLAMFA